MDNKSLDKILELAISGLPVCLKNSPREPSKIKNKIYQKKLKELLALPQVKQQFDDVMKNPPILQADSLPNYWCRVDKKGNAYIFLAQWKSKNLTYPIYSGQSYSSKNSSLPLTINFNGNQSKIDVLFEPYQSVMIKVSPTGKIKLLDISFRPKDPEVRPRVKQRTYF